MQVIEQKNVWWSSGPKPDMSELEPDNAGYLYSNLAPLNVTSRDSIKEALKEVINIPEEVSDE